MTPKRPDPAVPQQLVEAAARVLSEEGRTAVSARRLAREVGASTMAVYTHFGGMDELLAAVRREAFRRFGHALERPAATDDPVADWMVQGWAYRRFALDEPHLYRAMFGDVLHPDETSSSAEDDAAAASTFLSLLERIERCVAGGRWEVDDVTVAGEVVWADVHGLCSIELYGYFAATGRDVRAAHEEAMRRTARGYGDAPAAVERSIRAARRRAGRTALR